MVLAPPVPHCIAICLLCQPQPLLFFSFYLSLHSEELSHRHTHGVSPKLSNEFFNRLVRYLDSAIKSRRGIPAILQILYMFLSSQNPRPDNVKMAVTG